MASNASITTSGPIAFTVCITRRPTGSRFRSLPVTYVVASLLILMTVILVYADIVAPVSVS